MIFQKMIYFFLVFIPFLLFYTNLKFLWETWLEYVRTKFLLSRKMILLEIKISKEILKNPIAMELILNTFSETGGEGTWYLKYVKGGLRSIFSLEIISEGGNIRFFIWIESRYKEVYVSQLYSQYPSIEIEEVADYTRFKSYTNDLKMFGVEFGLKKEQALPIKTYRKFELDRAGIDVEEKIDPIANILEIMAAIESQETVWLQIVCRAHKDEIKVPKDQSDRDKEKWYDFFSMFQMKKKVNWTKEGQDKIKSIREGLEQDLREKGKFQRIMTQEEKDVITALEENMSKPPFDCGIRVLWISPGDFKPYAPTLTLGIFKHLSSNTLNSLVPKFVTSFDYPWSDRSGERTKHMKKSMFNDYKRREFFYNDTSKHYYTPWYPPEGTKSRYPVSVLSSEELATIFHFPSSVVQAPTFDRIESKKAEAPVNLPV